MRLKLFILFCICILIFSGCSSIRIGKVNSSNSWAYYGLVVWNNHTYLDSGEKVNEVGKQIGTIKYFSDKENDVRNDFSNKYKAGTKLFEIKNITIGESVAVEVNEGSYIKLNIKNR